MNRDQFQKWIDKNGTGQRENKSCNGIELGTCYHERYVDSFI